MSEHKIALARAFIGSHPEAAAEILEQQSTQEVADFLQQMPPHDAAQVLRKMLSKRAAEICIKLPFEAGIGMLRHLPVTDIGSILRCLTNKRRERFIAELPVKTRVSCILMLSYAEDMVGAHINHSVIVVPYDANAEEALRIVKATKEDAPSKFVFVIDRERKLVGQFNLVELLRCPNEFPIASLLNSTCKTIQGRMNIRQAATHSIWKQHEQIAVLNRNEEFIGVLRHADLRSAIELLNEQTTQAEQPELMAGIAQGYGRSLLALFLSMKEFVASDLQTLKGSEK
ncbi:MULTISPECIES: magnesium transporter MgtE N-terminal domain-containing protein [unclassified Lentimonas]|uniref:magnesium transporter MgtE N-terminal domain-containing protein n=1 Tax=unclassified Lentimonas TaxID=2630993 RepID=UPI001322F533|nr:MULTISPECIES: CBS domain-containing protein [unclassified Lentimonas]CAA6678830.1 Unannotated [Lentimonas sp. CC4]CAA6684434.1 Unannotated [Lentimonas sp. CC6]CAA7077487.1 Unannotated [Lentimonas sp. CC4]CAA7171321.1 Unannotated [Lentimonas sp. CC21]CAA7183351.1 Unannotated [Lentimonas sp. CC8]